MHVVDVLSLAGVEYAIISQVNRLDPGCFAPMLCGIDARREATHGLLGEGTRYGHHHAADGPAASGARGAVRRGWGSGMIPFPAGRP